MTHTEQLLALRERPPLRAAMLQSWRDLLFLHRSIDPAAIQALLPPGLEVDTWEDKAWVGLVPFHMEGIRPTWGPAVPWLSAFPETNVRTYVRHGDRPGVWFFSLDAARWLACAYARQFFGLPYYHSEMSTRRVGQQLAYRTDRKGSHLSLDIEATFSEPFQEAAPDTFEFWLLERYLLYALKSGKLYEGQVAHPPYTFSPARVVRCEQNLTEHVLGKPQPWEHVAFSPGVEVEVFSIQEVR